MENNSKQAILSIVGIAILVIAVVGVSFAFFTYSKQGETNNVITTGSIKFEYVEAENGMTITEQFPMSDADGVKRIGTDATNFQFHVTGTAPTNNAITYSVYVVPGDEPGLETDPESTHTTRMSYTSIGLALKALDGGVVETAYDAAKQDQKGTTLRLTKEPSGTDTKVAGGTITAGSKDVTHNYQMTMWVNDSVKISDTDANATYRATDVETGPNTAKEVYNTLYYSLKVNVTANA